MAAIKVNDTAKLIVATVALVLCSSYAQFDENVWRDVAHATHDGDKGSQTLNGACGYGELYADYGFETTALSTALFEDGLACGSCYQIMCRNSTWCLKDAQAIHVTVTNLCPPNYSKPYDSWCNPPQKHFVLSEQMFRSIAIYEGGIIPVYYRRVHCHRYGGIKFEMGGNQNKINVLIFNVGGAGDVRSVNVRGSNDTDWSAMPHSWGQNWETTDLRFIGQSLSFQVTTSDNRMVQSDDVVPNTWRFGETFEGKQFKLL